MANYRAELSAWIDEAVSTLQLTSATFRQLPDDDALLVYWQAEDRFVSKQRRHWWWEHFRCRNYGALLRVDARLHLTQLAATPGERVWLILTDVDELDPLVYKGADPLVYEGAIEACQRVIGECPPFEYNIVSHDFKWLLCENHHQLLFAVGFLAMRRLRRYAAQHPKEVGHLYVRRSM